MLNPKEFCIRCGHCYGFSDESCSSCGFDPCNPGPDEDDQQQAEVEWELFHDKRP